MDLILVRRVAEADTAKLRLSRLTQEAPSINRDVGWHVEL